VLLRLALAELRSQGVEFERAWGAAVVEAVDVVQAAQGRWWWGDALWATRKGWMRAYEDVGPLPTETAARELQRLVSGDAPPVVGRAEQRVMARALRRAGLAYGVIALALGLRDDRAAYKLIAAGGPVPQAFRVGAVRLTCPAGHSYDDARQGDGRWRRCRICANESARRSRERAKVAAVA
jgi:hypothetical protein